MTAQELIEELDSITMPGASRVRVLEILLKLTGQSKSSIHADIDRYTAAGYTRAESAKRLAAAHAISLPTAYRHIRKNEATK